MTEAPVKYPDRRSQSRQVVVGKHVEHTPDGHKSTPIKLYVGRKALEVK